jgi:acetyl-CoA C-acetyltransferase
MSGLGGKAAIIGTGMTKSGENFHQSLTGTICETKLGGSLPVNTSRGLKSCGHSIGSSWIRMIDNVHDQFLGRAGRIQVKGADMGLAHNVGGPGAVSAVAILSHP